MCAWPSNLMKQVLALVSPVWMHYFSPDPVNARAGQRRHQADQLKEDVHGFVKAGKTTLPFACPASLFSMCITQEQLVWLNSGFMFMSSREQSVQTVTPQLGKHHWHTLHIIKIRKQLVGNCETTCSF